MRYDMKPLFRERMCQLLPDQQDFAAFEKIVHTGPKNFIRCNTIKITPTDLLTRLQKKWNIIQPYPAYPEIMLIDQSLLPGELGNAIEHLLGYYYVQELSSMLSALALQPTPSQHIIDLCAAPGSKSSQIAALMQNQGTLIANEVKLDRIRILAATLERTACTNCIITREDGVQLCKKLTDKKMKVDAILLDAPCSGEGTLRSSPKTFLTWNPKVVEKMGRLQKKLLASALYCLKAGGTLVYSTCTHAPEENEAVIDFALKQFPVRLEKIALPVKTRPGITSWKGEEYHSAITNCHRIYPHDNDSEGFFVAKLTLLEELTP